MTTTKIFQNYRDVTNEWLKEATPNSDRVKNRNYFETRDGKRYYVDGKNVVFDYSQKERKMAEWLASNLGGKIYMIPRVNIPEGIRTADYLFRGEYWDLKEISAPGKRIIDNRINGLERQACNFIFDISRNSLSDNEIIRQVEGIYASKDRKWIDKIIIIRKNKLIKIYIRKRD